MNRILVLDHDGNVALHDLPSCFQINKLSAYTLLNTSSRGSNESITAVHIDEEGEKEFVYFGEPVVLSVVTLLLCLAMKKMVCILTQPSLLHPSIHILTILSPTLPLSLYFDHFVLS